MRGTWPAHLILPYLDHSNYAWQKVLVMKFLIMQFSPTSCHVTSL
jgi:hypothetical protein